MKHEIKDPLVTVVMPMYNEQKYVSTCLKSLVEQDYDQNALEILVIDGMSSDSSRAIVLEWCQKYPHITLLDNPKRIIPAALNIGIKAAHGDVIARVDAHSFVTTDFVSKCIECMQKSGADFVGGPLQYVSQSFMAKTISLAVSSPFGVGNSSFRYSKKEQFVDTVAFGAYRRVVFDRIGLFDENLVANEDYELAYRIRKTGGRIFLSPTIQSFYHNRASLPELWRQYFRYGFWKVRMLCKHPASIAPRQVVPPVFVLSLLLALLLGVFLKGFAYLFLVIVSIYLIFLLAASLLVVFKKGCQYLPFLPFAFMCLHIGWGAGFLWGLFRWGTRWKMIRAELGKNAL